MKHRKHRRSLSGQLLHRSRNLVPQDRQRRRVVRASNPPTLERALLCRKNTSRRTRFSSYRTYPTTTMWMVSPLSLAVSRASGRYDWCLGERELLLWSTRRRPEPSVRRRTPQGWLWEKRTRSSRLYINGNDTPPRSALWGFLCEPGMQIYPHRDVCTLCQLAGRVHLCRASTALWMQSANYKKCKM